MYRIGQYITSNVSRERPDANLQMKVKAHIHRGGEQVHLCEWVAYPGNFSELTNAEMNPPK